MPDQSLIEINFSMASNFRNNGWAVIIGISQYYESGITALKYAHKDAEALKEQLLSPACGNLFIPERIQILVNEQATTREINKALRTFLKQAEKDDVVIIYIAGHGAPDPDRLNNRYFLTYDTDPKDIASTGILMDNIQQSINDTIRAERIVVLADTCHSGGIQISGARSTNNEAQYQKQFLEGIAASRTGVAYLSSANVNESSSENDTLGHGVFTHYLLEGLKGKADGFETEKDGIITLGELFEYVQEMVKQETKNQQNPISGATYDRSMPIAYTGGIEAQEHLAIGKLLMHMSDVVRDPGIFRSAARHFEFSFRFAQRQGVSLPEALYWLGKAKQRVGNYAESVKILETFLSLENIQNIDQEFLVDSYFQMVVSAMLAEDKEGAKIHQQELLAHFPNHSKSAVAAGFLRQTNKSVKTLHILTISIDKYVNAPQYRLAGCVNDAELINETLKELWSTNGNQVVSHKIYDEAATVDNVVSLFSTVQKQIKAKDTVLVFFSGLAGKTRVRQNDSSYYLKLYDKDESKTELHVSDFHQMINKIPTQNKFLIIDSQTDEDFIRLIEQNGNYSALFGCDIGQSAYEFKFEERQHGVFTYILCEIINNLYSKALLYDIHEKIVEEMRKKGFAKQTPRMVGDIDLLFQPNLSATPSKLLHCVYQKPGDLTRESFLCLNYYVKTGASSKTPLFWFDAEKKILNYLINTGRPSEAEIILEKYANIYPNDTSILLPAIRLADQLGQYAKAENHLQNWIKSQGVLTEEHPARFLLKKYQNASGPAIPRYALLIGVSRYASLPPLLSAHMDAISWKQNLIETLGLPEENITLLLNEEASRERIRQEFDKHSKLAKDHPVLFFFAGKCSYENSPDKVQDTSNHNNFLESYPEQPSDSKYIMTLLSFDARTEYVKDLSFKELEDIRVVNNAKHLVAIVDGGLDYEYGNRVEMPQTNDLIRSRDALFPDAEDKNPIFYLNNFIPYSIGNATMLPGGVHQKNLSAGQKTWCIEDIYGGVFSVNLLKQISKKQVLDSTITEISERLRNINIPFGSTDWKGESNYYLVPFILGDPESMVLNFTRLGQEELDQWNLLAYRELGERLQRLGTSNVGEFPDYQVNLALVKARLGNLNEAIWLLEQAAADETKEKERDMKANYHLGRLLVEADRDADKENWSRALSALRIVTGEQPDFAPAYYYLGKSINKLMVLEGKKEALKAFRRYEQEDYPIGYQEEVSSFLGTLDEDRLKKHYMEKGLMLLQQNDLLGATIALKAALQLNEPLANYHLGEIYERQNDYLLALNTYNLAKISGAIKDDLPFKIGNMYMEVFSDIDTCDEIFKLVDEYNKNTSILKHKDTEQLLGYLEIVKNRLQPKIKSNTR